jgi:hypothetical protein
MIAELKREVAVLNRAMEFFTEKEKFLVYDSQAPPISPSSVSTQQRSTGIRGCVS